MSNMALRYIGSTNAKDISIVYLIYGVIMGCVGYAYSIIIRLELYSSGRQLIGSMDHTTIYYVIVTNHGLIMIFSMIVPILIGSYGNMLTPIQIGSIDMSHARVNNISLMLYLPGTVLLLMSSIIDKGSAVGWTIYYPLSGVVSSSSISIEYLIPSIHILGVSSIPGAINFIITIITWKTMDHRSLNIFV